MSPRNLSIVATFLFLATPFQTMFGQEDSPEPALGPLWERGIQIGSFEFSEDDILTAYFGFTKFAYQISKKEIIYSIPDYRENDLAYHSESEVLATINDDDSLVLFNRTIGRILSATEISSNRVRNMQFSKDGSRLLIQGSSFLTMVDVISNEILWSIEPLGGTSLTWHENSSLIENFRIQFRREFGGPITGDNQILELRSDHSGEVVWQIENPAFANGIRSESALVASGKFTLQTVESGSATLVLHETLEAFELNHSEDQLIKKAHVLNNSRSIATLRSSSDDDFHIQGFVVYSLDSLEEDNSFSIARTNQGYTTQISAFDFSADESKLFLGTVTGDLEIWNWNTMEIIDTLPSVTGQISEIQLYHGGTRCFTESMPGTLILWDLENNSQISSYSTDLGAILNEGESTLVARSRQGYLQILNPTTGEIIEALPNMDDTIEAAFFNEDGSRYHVVQKSGMVILFNAENDNEISRFQLEEVISGGSGKFESGPYFLAFNHDHILSINAENGESVSIPKPKDLILTSGHFTRLSKDGNRLLIRQSPPQRYPAVSNIV